MLKSVSKKIMSGFLAAAMVVTLMPATPAQAATASISGKTAAVSGTTYSYTVKNVTKNQYIKVKLSGTATGAVATVNKKPVKNGKTSAFVKGTGKDLTFKVAAKNAGKSYKLTVKVYKKDKKTVVKTLTKTAKVYSHSISKITGSTTVEVGKKVTLKAVKKYSQSKKAVTWASSKTSVATVGKTTGVVTGKKAGGTATITATCGTSKKSVKVTVKAAKPEEKPDDPTKPDDTVSGDTVSGDTVSGDTVSGDTVSGDTVSGDTTSGNTVTTNKTVVSLNATAAKTLVAKFTGECVSTDFVLTKGTASKPAYTLTISGDTAIFNLEARLTAGEYKVTVGDSTASYVATDETLTSYKLVSNKLVADAVSSDKATIKFQALNQYNEVMTKIDGTTTASCSFGKVSPNTVDIDSKSGVGTVTVEEIPVTLQNPTQTGTITLVNNKTGVSLVASDVTYASTSTATTVELAGLYSKFTEGFKDIKAGDEINGDAYILMTFKDQYGENLDADTLKKSVGAGSTLTFTLSSGMTNVEAVTTNNLLLEKITVSGQNYVGFPLKVSADKKVKAGEFYLNIVNNRVGLLATKTYKVEESVVLASFKLEPKNTLYSGDKTEMAFEALDKDGNAVKNYSVIKEVNFDANGSGSYTVDKQKDGSAKIYFQPSLPDSVTGKNSQTVVTTIKFNDSTTANYKVLTQNFTVYAARVPAEITGIKDSQITAGVSKNTAEDGVKPIELTVANLKVVDQYENLMSEKDLEDVEFTVSSNDLKVVTLSSNNTKFVKDKIAVSMNKSYPCLLEVVTPNGVANITVTMPVQTDVKKASSYTFEVSAVDATKAVASTLKIKSVYDGYVIPVSGNNGSTIINKNIVVEGKVDGKTVRIPESQYTIISTGVSYFDKSKEGETSKEGTLKIVVNTTDKAGNSITTPLEKKVTYSNKKPVITTLKDAAGVTSVTSNAISHNLLVTAVEIKDQYGKTPADGVKELAASANTTGITYEVEVLNAVTANNLSAVNWSSNVIKTSEIKISNNGTNKIEITPKATPTSGSKVYAKVVVTITSGDLSVTKTMTLGFEPIS